MSERSVFCIVAIAIALVVAGIAANDYGKVRIAMEHGYCEQQTERGKIWVKCQEPKP